MTWIDVEEWRVFEWTTIVTIAVAVGVIWIACRGMKPGARRGEAQGLCSLLGVLGTFTGIFLGLAAFDSSNIGASVPALLAGLKTAFLTSILAMLCSFFLKSLDLCDASKPRISEMTLTEDLAGTMRRIETLLIDTRGAAVAGQAGLASTAENFKSAVEAAREAIQAEASNHLAVLAEINTKASAAIEQLVTEVAESQAECHDQLKLYHENSIEEMEAMVSDLSDVLQKRLNHLDQGMEQELTNALGSFGNCLAALSEKFAADYEPLTKHLANVVRLADRLEKAKKRGDRSPKRAAARDDAKMAKSRGGASLDSGATSLQVRPMWRPVGEPDTEISEAAVRA